MMKRVLVTGASGFIGSHLARACRDTGAQVVGTRSARPAALEGVRVIPLDISAPLAVQNLVSDVRPGLVFHCGAIAKPDDCAADPQRCRAVNVEGTRNLVAAAAQAGAQVVFFSTDQVFDGRSSWYSEDDPPAPLGVYGRSKLEAEQLVLDEPRVRPLVVRTALTYGWAGGFGFNFLESWLRILRAGQPLGAFADQYRTPILVHDLVEALLRLGSGGHQGTLHVGGVDRLSRHQMALALAERFGISPDLVTATTMKGMTFADPRPHDVSMRCDKLAATIGFRPRGFHAGLKDMRETEGTAPGELSPADS